MKTFFQKLYHIVHRPQIGDVYIRELKHANPFIMSLIDHAEVIDLRDGWVKFKIVYSTWQSQPTYAAECRISEFKGQYKFMEKKWLLG